ncbi:acyl-CoA synthetase [Nocardioides flavus (ex Wang et al. 2016)]|uniref:Acyl-CoA synthetase n=1 Tax=Nocardioides flavus (ex Wang et al. 2016) TaxID=2058780 RepID=A0ABQ3HJZ4_9ACTN|nr:AMP-binding protein [Nocardioides flavus (ex Wang et al. 2016)]GHE16757.1 acyl-CoA synthetase [Nocardioides flavus (ex Wang et al. 2016)]
MSKWTTPETRSLQHNLIQRVNVGDSLTRSASRYPDKEAVVDGDRRLTYRQFDEQVNTLANGLIARGYARGDALALMSGNSLEFLVVYYACAKAGLIVVPISLVWRTAEISYVIGHSRAKGVVVESQLVDTLLPALSDHADVELIVAPGLTEKHDGMRSARGATPLEELAAGQPTTVPEVVIADRDPLSYMYTSGTTSAPKGVVSSHLGLYMGSLTAAHEMRFTAEERMLAMMPLFHIAQLNAFTTPVIMVGGTVVLKRGFDAPGLLALVEKERLSFVFGLPVMYREMLDHPDTAGTDLSSLRRAGYAMAPLPKADLLRAMETFGCGFSLGFGQTEMVPMTTIFQPEHQISHHGAVGEQIVNVQIEIMDEHGNLLPHGQTGEIVYRGPHALEEYLDNEEASNEVMRHGWFHSGDLGHFDEGGMLWFEDRAKDVIKSGGENVASLEVERAMYEADSRIKEVAVVGLPHPRWIEAVTAIVIPHPGEQITEAELWEALKTKLPPFKRPKSILIVDNFPRTATGKIQKNVLRQQHGGYYQEVPRSTEGASDDEPA